MSQENNNHSNKRMAVRYDCIGLLCSIGNKDASVTNMSLEGLAIETDKALDIDPDKPSKIKLQNTNSNCHKTLSATPAGQSNTSDVFRYHFKFVRPQRPESFGDFNRHFSTPCEHPKSNRQRYELQNELAGMDINTLEGSIQGLKSCQFQLIMAAMPILFGLLASIVAFVSSEVVKPVHYFYYLIPPASIVLSFILLAVFIQKTEAIRRASAFTLILQRHLAMGSIPACYRGWHDAYENYNHFVRHGAEENSPFNVAPFKERKIKHKLPADSFTWLAIGVFSVIPVFSLIAMIYIFSVDVKSSHIDLGSYTAIIFASAIFFTVAAFWFYNKYKALTVGKRSFRYLVVLFSKLLKYAPPFDPYKNEPIGTQSKST